VEYIILSQIVRLSIMGHETKYKRIICEKGLKKPLIHVIWSHYMNLLDRFWITITYGIFEMPKSLHHVIMDSLYLLKFLIEWFFYIKNNVMPLIQRKKKLKDFEHHKLKFTMKYAFFKSPLFIWINNPSFHFLNVKFLHNYL
jgi:hypothetical protein